MGSIMKSEDGGKNWEAKVKVDEDKYITGAEVLSMAIDPKDSEVIYIGTKEEGIFKTNDGGNNWEQLNFPPIKAYGLAVDHLNPDVLYATGAWEEVSKIYKSENGGADWKEIYTEPAGGTVIISLAMSPLNNNVLYVGTSGGAIFKTVNKGESWVNITNAENPVTGIEIDRGNDEVIYFMVLDKGILITRDGGKKIEDLDKNIRGDKFFGGDKIYTVAVDPSKSGVVYAGLSEGILRSDDFGNEWKPINILESSKEYPINSIAVNPKNSQEIMYSAAQAVYKSIDGGAQWKTTEVQTSRTIGLIKYNPYSPSKIYLGLRK